MHDVPDTGEAQTALDLLRALLAGYATVSDRPDLCDEAAALLDALRADRRDALSDGWTRVDVVGSQGAGQ